MNILIIGCGKVGSMLANTLSNDGHDISIVDTKHDNFDNLDSDFSGFTTTGLPIDLDVLKEAGIKSCDILAAVSNDDTINIMVSQLAKEIFNIPKVISRINDPILKDVFSDFNINTISPTNLTVSSVLSFINKVEKTDNINIGSHTISFPILKDVFSDFNINTISPTNLTVSSVLSFINKVEKTDNINIGSHTISFSTISIPKKLVGQSVKDIEFDEKEFLYAILHSDNSISIVDNNSNIILSNDDKIIISKIVD